MILNFNAKLFSTLPFLGSAAECRELTMASSSETQAAEELLLAMQDYNPIVRPPDRSRLPARLRSKALHTQSAYGLAKTHALSDP